MTRYEIDCSKCKQIIIVDGEAYCKIMREGKKAVFVETHAGTKEDPDIVKCHYFIRTEEGAEE